jgi:hypothetical protein
MGHQELLEILGCCHYHKSDMFSKVGRQGKIYSCRRVCLLTGVRQASTQGGRTTSVFVPIEGLFLVLKRELRFTVSVID